LIPGRKFLYLSEIRSIRSTVDTMEKYLSPKELAEAIGVSESSLKRWVDEEWIAASRTAGGHRRIALSEAVRFIRKAGVAVVKPELLGIPGLSKGRATTPAESDALLSRAVLEGRASDVRSLVLSSYVSGRDIAAICDGPLTSAMHTVGEYWQHSARGIALEHRAVEICAQALHMVRTLFPAPGPSAPIALGGSLEGDPYFIPSLMVSVVLAAAGWNSINFGPNIPSAALLSAVQEYKPTLTWISCSVDDVARQRERELRKTCETLTASGTRVVLGGRGWDAHRPELGDGQIFASSMGAAAAFAEGLLSPPRSRRRVLPGGAL
jgi:excisionase family DNA binding protein